MLISKLVKTIWNSRTKKYYESKGYIYTKMGDEFDIKIEDLLKSSKVKVKVKCDGEDCENPYLLVVWTNYNKYIHENGKYNCNKCAKKLYSSESSRKTKLKKSKSFEQWCIDNNRQDVLERWDYEKNINNDDNVIKPSDISYSSHGINNKGYWFKCLEHPEHESELKNTASFIKGLKGSMNCKQCNSFAQWGIDNICPDFLEKYWDYEKNTDKNENPIDPFKASYGSKEMKVWIKCQEKDYHGSYKVSCNNFKKGARCSYCHNRNNGKIHPLDSLGQYIVNNFGQEFLDKVWSEKNKKSPYEYMPRGIEKAWWHCPEDKHDDYKREINVSNRIEFRCPKCMNERDESLLQEKVRLYLEEINKNNGNTYEILHENKCTLNPKNIIEPANNNKNKKRGKGTLRYDNEIIIQNNHLFIEVMGSQHEKVGLFHLKISEKYGITSQQELEYQIAKDKFKEQYVYDQGENYYYLAIWYYHDDSIETWRKIINDKIDKILNNTR